LQLFSLVPTISPGRYLYALKDKKDAVAVLETAIGSANVYGGLGYRWHNIGVFTNVFEDHIGERIKNRTHLAEYKGRYIFSRVAPEGTAIFNADDKYVCSQLWRVPKDKNIKLLPVGLKFSQFDVKKHLAQGGSAVTLEDNKVVVLKGKKKTEILDGAEVPWTFGGHFTPSLFNLMFVTAVVYAHNSESVPDNAVRAIKSYKLAKGGGRLSLWENTRTGIKALLDFAHEKYSLKEVSILAKKLADNKTIGVIRLAPDRTDKLIQETGKFLANKFDVTIIYDKIDGVNVKEHKNLRTGEIRRTGEVSRLLFDAMREASNSTHKVMRVVEEKDAVAKAFSLVERGDMVVHIVNDDHDNSLALVRKHLGKLFVKRRT